MINEVTITMKFITGTSVQDSRQAEEACVALLKEKLRENQLATEHGDSGCMGLFAMTVLNVESEKI